MVTIICQHSGLEFEAETKRTKQHPRIATFKAKADRDGTYRDANNALTEANKRGGYTTIDEYMAFVNTIMLEYRDKERIRHDRAAAAYRREEEARKQMQTERDDRNATLKASGYKWSKYIPDEDSQEIEYTRWELYSPDGRLVTEQQALDEIERGVEVVRAEIDAKRKAEAQRQAELAYEQAHIEKAEREAVAEFDVQVKQIESANHRIEPITFDILDTIRIQWPSGRKHSYYRHIDKIQHGQVNGVDCWRITTGSGYDDDGYDSYYCADPDKVHATPMTASNNNSFF